MNPWLEHLKKVREQHPELKSKQKEIIKLAKETYKVNPKQEDKMWGKKKEPEMSPIPQRQMTPAEIIQPIQQQVQQQAGIARVVSIELIDGGFKYTILSNKLFAQIGEELPLE
jgi:hypothetical protein